VKYKPLKVTAYLSGGLDTGNSWTPALDGILAYFYLENKMGIDQFSAERSQNTESLVDDMPIQKFFDKQDKDIWVYQCSSPFVKVGRQEIIEHYKRFNLNNLEYLKVKTKTVALTKGKHKNWIFKVFLKLTEKVEWYIVADKPFIEKMLSNCTHIGANRGAGYGRVIKWAVIEDEHAESLSMQRPVPLSILQGTEIDNDAKIQVWGFRPSVRLHSNKAYCLMP